MDLIVGLSISGVAAAIELRSLNRHVGIVEYGRDTAVLRGRAFIDPIPALTTKRLSGPEFDRVAIDHLRNIGVELLPGIMPNDVKLCIRGHDVFLSLSTGVMLPINNIIFAPNGRIPPMPSFIAGSVDLYGISTCAWSDAMFYKNRPVAIFGCGSRAFDQELIVSQWASRVTIFCVNRELSMPKGLLSELISRPNTEVITDVCALRLVADTAGRKLIGLTATYNGLDKSIVADALFNANQPVLPSQLDIEVDGLHAGKWLHVSGIASGIDYIEHLKLFDDGTRAARECVR